MKRAVVTLLALAIAGCGEGATEPAPEPFVVTITSQQVANGYARMADGRSVYACDFTITARASGGAPGDFAEWVSAEANYMLASTGARDTWSLSRTDLVGWFSSDRITRSPAEARRVTWWSGPFQMNLELRYLMPDGETKAHTFFLTCN